MKKSGLLVLLMILMLMGTAPINGKSVETVSLWAMGVEGQNIGKLLPQFEAENPGIKVKLQVIPWSAANDRLITAVAGGTVPDGGALYWRVSDLQSWRDFRGFARALCGDLAGRDLWPAHGGLLHDRRGDGDTGRVRFHPPDQRLTKV